MKKSKANKTAGTSHVAHQRLVSCHFDDKMTVGKGFGRLSDHGTKSGETYTDGSVVTPHGIVLAYSQGDADSFHHTRLDVVKNGTLYMKNIKRRYSKRGLVTLAKRFAATVAANEKADLPPTGARGPRRRTARRNAGWLE